MVDVSNPVSPTLVVALPITTSVMTIQEDYAYLADNQGWLRVVDITNPTSPEQVAAEYMSGDILHIEVSTNPVYVLTGGNIIHMIDIQTPNNPLIVDTYRAPLLGGVLVRNDHYAYVFDNGLAVVDVANPHRPTVVGQVDFQGDPFNNMGVNDHFIYISSYCFGIRIVDILDPVHPVEASLYPIDECYNEFVVLNHYLYFVEQGTLNIINVQDPYHPYLEGTFILPSTTIRPVYGRDNLLYLWDGGIRFWFFSVDEATNPQLIKEYTIPYSAYKVGGTGPYYGVIVYSAIDNPVFFLDMTDPDNIYLIGIDDTQYLDFQEIWKGGDFFHTRAFNSHYPGFYEYRTYFFTFRGLQRFINPHDKPQYGIVKDLLYTTSRIYGLLIYRYFPTKVYLPTIMNSYPWIRPYQGQRVTD